MFEMEREAHFAGAADRVPISRSPAEVAREIARLLGEYLALPVLGIYAINSSRTELSDLLGSNSADTSKTTSRAPSSLPVSILKDQNRPAIVSLSSLTVRESTSVAVDEKPVNGDLKASGDDQTQSAHQENDSAIPEAEQLIAGGKIDDVLIWPWSGPFEWAGMILASGVSGATLETIESYLEPLTRLTDRLAIALEFQRDDVNNDSSQLRAARTADFSRSLISCLEQSQPLDAVVREITRLISC